MASYAKNILKDTVRTDVKVYEQNELKTLEYKTIQPVNATSCKHLLWDPNYLSVTGYSLKRLYDNLGKLQAAEVVVLLDSCFSGAGGRSVLAKGARPLVMMTDAFTLPSNMAVLTATQGTQISTSSPEKGHGIFTYYFLKALKDGKNRVSEIYEYIKPLVEDEAKTLNVQQSPGINPDADKLKGRFILRK